VFNFKHFIPNVTLKKSFFFFNFKKAQFSTAIKERDKKIDAASILLHFLFSYLSMINSLNIKLLGHILKGHQNTSRVS
jgi:hypothetical protein